VRHTRYELRDADGTLVAVHVREDLPSGRKRMWWQRPDGARGLNGLRPTDLLFGLERLRSHPGEPVVLVEGEKSATALHQAGVLAVATVCGAAAVPSEAVLKHLLGRPVVLWPDADEPGRRHVARVAEALHRLGHRDVWIVNPPEGVKPGWDAADAVAEGRDVQALLAAAKPYERPSMFRPVSELSAPPVTWVCEPFVPCGALTVLSGKDKRGKTLLALELVRAVLLGEPFLGRFEVRRGPVVAAFLDDPLGITLERLEALGVRRHPDLFLVDPRTADDPRKVLRELEADALRRRAALAVWDALYLLLPEGRESLNDAARMRPLVLTLDALAARAECGFVVVAHDNKAGADVAGSFVVRAAAKSILRLTLPPGEAQDDDEPATPRRHLRLESKLARSEVWALDLEGPARWVFHGTARQAREQDLKAAIVGFLESRGPSSRDEILRGVPGKTATKLRVLEELARQGVVVTEGGGRKGDPRRFTLAGAPDGQGTAEKHSVPVASTRAGNGERNRLKPRQDADEFRSRPLGTELVFEGGGNGIPPGTTSHPSPRSGESPAPVALAEAAPLPYRSPAQAHIPAEELIAARKGAGLCPGCGGPPPPPGLARCGRCGWAREEGA